ncbi:MAG: hypothetical protein LBH59_09080 [Planctomycetaceae bacterium]|nr:hypothetical protein [Planctomycetaceae bacterium]
MERLFKGEAYRSYRLWYITREQLHRVLQKNVNDYILSISGAIMCSFKNLVLICFL